MLHVVIPVYFLCFFGCRFRELEVWSGSSVHTSCQRTNVASVPTIWDWCTPSSAQVTIAAPLETRPGTCYVQLGRRTGSSSHFSAGWRLFAGSPLQFSQWRRDSTGCTLWGFCGSRETARNTQYIAQIGEIGPFFSYWFPWPFGCSWNCCSFPVL